MSYLNNRPSACLIGWCALATALFGVALGVPMRTAFAQTTAPVVNARAPIDTGALGAQLSVEHIQDLDPWVTLSGHRVFVPAWGSVVARATVGRRFGATGVQGEMEAYPRLGRIGYLYAAVAASPNEEVFVPLRSALELFSSPSPGLEISGGARFFRTSSDNIVAYTGSVGAYRGNYWMAFRPYVVRHNGAVSNTGQMSLRRYWAGRYDHVGLYLSATRGSDPTVDDPTRLERAPELTSFSARIERLRPVRNGTMRIGYGIGAESQEVAASDRRTHVTATFRIERLLP